MPIQRTLRAAACAIMLAAFVGAGTRTLQAQPIPWNPPCVNTKCFNNTPCNATVTLATIPPGVVAPVFIAAGTSSPFAIPFGTTVTGVTTQAGAFVPIVSPGPPLPPPQPPGPPTVGWCSGVIMGPNGCCFDVYIISAAGPNCLLWLEPGTPPCTP